MMNGTSDTGSNSGRSDPLGQQRDGISGRTSIAALLGSLASPDRVQAQLLPSTGSDIQRFLAQHRQQQQPMPPPLPALSSLSHLILQQQQQQQLQQLQQGRLQLGDSSSMSGSSFDAPQLIKQQEEQRLADLMLLQQRQAQPSLFQPFIAEQLRSGSGLAASQLLRGASQPQNHLTDAKQLQQRAAEDARVMDRMNAVAAIAFSDKSRSDGNEEDVAKTKDSKPQPDPQVEEEYEEDKDDASCDIDYRAETFPFKLFRMLDEATKNGNDDVVSFLPSGRAFAIHKPREFITEMMPKYFTTSRMSSFQRQLNLYGFRRITEGNDKGGYFHQHFQKGRKGLCRKIKRKKKTAKAPRNFFLDSQPASQMGPSVSVRQLIADVHMRNGLLPEGQPLTQSGGDLQLALVAAQLAEQQRRQQQELLLQQLLLREQQEKTRLDENKSRG